MDQLKLTTETEAAAKANDLATVMQIKGISHRSMVNLMQTEFPRFDSPLLSKVKRPDLYGVVLHPRGYEIIGAFPDRKKENRKLKKRIYGRLSEEEYAKLLVYIEKDGFADIQHFLRAIIQDYIINAELELGRIE